MNLVINHFKVDIKRKEVKAYFHFDVSENVYSKFIWAKYKLSRILEFDFIKNLQNKNQLKNKLLSNKKVKIEDEIFVYISFYSNSEYYLNINLSENKALFKKWLKETFIQKLKGKYLVEPFREGGDFSLYKEIDIFEENIKKYIRYDFVFNIYGKPLNLELSVSIGSKDTYIGPVKGNDGIDNDLKIVVDNLLIKRKECPEDTSYKLLKFNKELRTRYKISPHPIFQFYKEYHKEIREFVRIIANEMKEELNIYPNFIIKNENEIKLVDFENNKMVFKDEQKDYSTINGMRDYGPYKVPEDVAKVQLVFIYPDSESANKLASYFSRGYRNFPGLESYVGIPANFSDIKIKYDIDENNILKLINDRLTEKSYENLIAICIMPFSKTTATEEQRKQYYEIKKILLHKNIPSQFIERKKIFLENFHFSLPNIAVAMLAKIGGIPWKLARDYYKQLIVGFNIYKVNDNNNSNNENKYLGSAVYFDNEGIIRKISFNTSNDIQTVISQLSEAIYEYKEENQNIEKLFIHYYKPLNEKENKEIESYLKETFSSTISFVVVEINDTKTSTDLCFDLDYERLMPRSGTYVKLKPNEYLLFNNLRYWERPENPIRQEEYPIKLKIFDPANAFDHHELISQVYEFSRMYWKSLKQKAQPITIIYSKLIAEYMANMGLNTIPDNEIAQKTVWFI